METELNFIGIDVSKDTLDICLLSERSRSFIVKNREKDIARFFNALLEENISYHICAENTGKYTWSLMSVLADMDCDFYVVNPLHLKRSLGLVRGKNDKVDAVRIAHFIKKNYTETKTYVQKRNVIEDLQILLSERGFRINQRKQLKTKNKELMVLGNQKLAKHIIEQNNRLIKELTVQVKAIEQQVRALLKSDTKLNTLSRQLKSIPGVGDVLCWNILVKTNEFKSITQPRKLACYCGVAPFQNTSGTSIFGRNRVSNLADKSLKKLLHLGAMSAIRLENDLALYYKRKVNEGKNKMSVLNAVRNKIIHLIFALIKTKLFIKIVWLRHRNRIDCVQNKII